MGTARRNIRLDAYAPYREEPSDGTDPCLYLRSVADERSNCFAPSTPALSRAWCLKGRQERSDPREGRSTQRRRMPSRDPAPNHATGTCPCGDGLNDDVPRGHPGSRPEIAASREIVSHLEQVDATDVSPKRATDHRAGGREPPGHTFPLARVREIAPEAAARG